MRIAFVVHSVVSCWNNGNAHYLRGVMKALAGMGHEVRAFEPAGGWSRENALREAGDAALVAPEAAVPGCAVSLYGSVREAVEAIAGFAADLVIVHEWNEPDLVNALGRRHRGGGRGVLLFHDTHHRAVTKPEEMSRFDLSAYDGVLAFGGCIAGIYEGRGWGRRVWTWHEAADTDLFRPLDGAMPEGDLVWIGNWGDDERSDEIRSYLLDPATALRLATTVYGVRYPEAALAELAARGVRYGGWLPNNRAPEIFAGYRATVHVPRRPYVEALPGIPTIRVFEALACGIPLVSAPWRDEEGLFPEGAFLMARDPAQMKEHLGRVMQDPDLAASLAATGLEAVLARHTCRHRAEELVAIRDTIAGNGNEATMERAAS